MNPFENPSKRPIFKDLTRKYTKRVKNRVRNVSKTCQKRVKKGVLFGTPFLGVVHKHGPGWLKPPKTTQKRVQKGSKTGCQNMYQPLKHGFWSKTRVFGSKTATRGFYGVFHFLTPSFFRIGRFWPFFHCFFTVFHCFCPSWTPNPELVTNGSKRPFCDRFRAIASRQSKYGQKRVKNRSKTVKTANSEKNRGQNVKSPSFPSGRQNGPKNGQKRGFPMEPLLCGCPLTRPWVAETPQNHSKRGPKRVKKGVFLGPSYLGMSINMALGDGEPPKTAQKGVQKGSFWTPFWAVLGGFRSFPSVRHNGTAEKGSF